jgi:hypothetical protein
LDGLAGLVHERRGQSDNGAMTIDVHIRRLGADSLGSSLQGCRRISNKTQNGVCTDVVTSFCVVGSGVSKSNDETDI